MRYCTRSHYPKRPGSDKSKASSQANAQPAEPFFKRFHREKGVKNMLPGHEKLKLYTTKSHLGGVYLVGLSL